MVDAQQIAEKVRDLLMGAIREEFREFKAEVRGQLEGFRLAIETMNKRLDSIERRLDNLEKRVDETNQRIDRLTDVIISLSTRVDRLAERVEENTIELKELKAKEKIIEDILRRLQKLEDHVFA